MGAGSFLALPGRVRPPRRRIAEPPQNPFRKAYESGTLWSVSRTSQLSSSDETRERLVEEHAALRRVATLVAQGVRPDQIFAAVSNEVGRLVGTDSAAVVRYADDGEGIVFVGVASKISGAFPLGAEWKFREGMASAEVYRTGRSARSGAHLSTVDGPVGDTHRQLGIVSAVASPIVVEGRLWGAMAVHGKEPLPPDTQERVEKFTELVATAIANAEGRAALTRLAEEQAALHRVATLVARGMRADEIFAAVSDEVARLVGTDSATVIKFDDEGPGVVFVGVASNMSDAYPLGARWKFQDGMASAEVYRTGRSARSGKRDWSKDEGPVGETHHRLRIVSTVASPILVEGRLWGAMAVQSQEPLPPDTEERLEKFTELLATAIANAESGEALARLAEEQAALRRVATLVARGVRADELFATVGDEVGRLVGTDSATVMKFDDDGEGYVFVGVASKMSGAFPLGARWKFQYGMASAEVYRTGRSARSGAHLLTVEGPVGDTHRQMGIISAVASPIAVDGSMWGAIAVQGQEPLPPGTEERLEKFTELLATAIANAESREALARLAEEQTALRRVATLVARGTPPEEVFAAVANEVGHLFSVELANVCRYELDGTLTFVASAGGRFPLGSRWPLGGQKNLATLVLETGRSARLDSYADATGPLAEGIRAQGIHSAVGTPILVEGRLWGVMAAATSREQALPPDTEARLASFTELVATAISNAEARTEVGRLVDEQAALRRVATLVAEEAEPSEVFETVTREVGILCGADLARMERYESADSVIGLAGWSRDDGPELAVGARFSLEGTSIAAQVHEASRPVRVDSFAGAHGPIAQEARGLGIRSSVGCPIVVDGRLWGAIAASSTSATPFPPGTESQITAFTELVATAISNAEVRTEVAASRARIVAATDDERRRVVRDLHDGAQQRLVHTVITLKLAHRALETEEPRLPALLTEALDHAERATGELRELAHGILPAVLTQGGLRAGVDALASRMPLPVETDLSVGRLPSAVEATAYFVVAEALTNVAKHARAGHADVTALIEDGTVRVQVRDDGVGGARPDGSGLTGLADRLAVLDGQLRVESPVDGGTLVAAYIPLTG
jgi:GAF domain-containing protein